MVRTQVVKNGNVNVNTKDPPKNEKLLVKHKFPDIRKLLAI